MKRRIHAQGDWAKRGPYVLNIHPTSLLPKTMAGRLELIRTLLGGPMMDPETGEVVDMPALITKEQALRLLDAPADGDSPDA